jgi:hypothetical protein
MLTPRADAAAQVNSVLNNIARLESLKWNATLGLVLSTLLSIRKRLEIMDVRVTVALQLGVGGD